MSEFPVPLDNLIAYVRAMHPNGDPLANVSDAFAVSTQLDEQADALIGHFVDQARKSGASWSQIGTAMGVSKQAAQKRFVVPSRGEPYSRFTDRAVRVIIAAHLLAGGQPEGDQRPPISPAHVAAALLVEPEGVAAKAIAAAGISAEQVYAALGTGPAPVGVTNQSTLRLKAGLLKLNFDEATTTALKDTLRWALRYGHNYIGTEHLLLGLLFAGGPVSEAFTALGLPPQRANQFISAEIAAFQARKTG